jgi:hypothetical protein
MLLQVSLSNKKRIQCKCYLANLLWFTNAFNSVNGSPWRNDLPNYAYTFVLILYTGVRVRSNFFCRRYAKQNIYLLASFPARLTSSVPKQEQRAQRCYMQKCLDILCTPWHMLLNLHSPPHAAKKKGKNRTLKMRFCMQANENFQTFLLYYYTVTSQTLNSQLTTNIT